MKYEISDELNDVAYALQCKISLEARKRFVECAIELLENVNNINKNN